MKKVFGSTIFIVVLTLVAVASTTRKAQDTQSDPMQLYARAMLVRLPADDFQPIHYSPDQEFGFADPMDIAMSIFASSNTEMIRIAEIQSLSGSGKYVSGETKSYDKVQAPTRKQVYSKDKGEVYYLTEYIWIEEKCDFKLIMQLNSNDSSLAATDNNELLNCNCTFSYTMPDYIPEEKLDEQTDPEWISPAGGDRLVELIFDVNSAVTLKIGQTAVVSCQKIKGDYWVLLLNVSEYDKTK